MERATFDKTSGLDTRIREVEIDLMEYIRKVETDIKEDIVETKERHKQLVNRLWAIGISLSTIIIHIIIHKYVLN